MEQTFGTVVGNLYATLERLNVTNFGISIATNNNNAYPSINCKYNGGGNSGTHNCQVQSYSGDQWSGYYLFDHVEDLFINSSVAQSAAAAAALAVSSGTPFALTPAQLYVNTTQLNDPTTGKYGATACPNFKTSNDCIMVSLAAISCGLNEDPGTMASADQEPFTLNNMSSSYGGINTQLGVQTMVGLDVAHTNPQGVMQPDYCTAPMGSTNLTDIFGYGISNGAQFIEVTADLAADPDCWPHLSNALTAIAQQTQTHCLY